MLAMFLGFLFSAQFMQIPLARFPNLANVNAAVYRGFDWACYHRQPMNGRGCKRFAAIVTTNWFDRDNQWKIEKIPDIEIGFGGRVSKNPRNPRNPINPRFRQHENLTRKGLVC